MNLLLPDGGDPYAADDEAADPYAADGPLAAAHAMLQRMGVPLPPLVEALLPLLTQAQETVFTTQDGTTSLANRTALVARAARGDMVSGLSISHEGYGANSWSLRYHAVLPRVALFVEIPFGGAYMDLGASQLQVETAWASAARLLQAAAASTVGACVVVDHRGLAGSRWCVAGPQPQWRDSANAIDDAAAAFEAAA